MSSSVIFAKVFFSARLYSFARLTVGVIFTDSPQAVEAFIWRINTELRLRIIKQRLIANVTRIESTVVAVIHVN
jgi:hypothetical protein